MSLGPAVVEIGNAKGDPDWQNRPPDAFKNRWLDSTSRPRTVYSAALNVSYPATVVNQWAAEICRLGVVFASLMGSSVYRIVPF